MNDNIVIRNQLSRDAAMRLFDYRDGMLFWRQAASGRRKDRKAVTLTTTGNRRVAEVRIGGVCYKARYVVWNWHHGRTSKAIEASDGDGWNLAIGNLAEVELSPNFIYAGSTLVVAGAFASHQGIACPCCRQTVDAPSLDVVVQHYGVSAFQEKILATLWDAKGRPVPSQRLFDAMYADDPDGGPTAWKANAALKEAMHRLRGKLADSGIEIVSTGRGEGYRLVMNAEQKGEVA